MRRAQSGVRGVFWRAKPNGSQERRVPGGGKERGEWWVRWMCGFGHLHREKIGPKSVAQAECDRRRTQARREGFCPRVVAGPRPLLFEDAVAEYLEWAKVNKRSWFTDEHRLRLLKARFAGKTLDEITPQDIDRLKSELAAERAPATVNRYLACLKHLYNRAIRDGNARGNPVKAVSLFRENNARVRWLAPEEEKALLPVVPDPFRSLCVVAIHTGLRLGELLGLTWSRADFRTAILTVDRSNHGGARRVPMNSRVREVLKRIPRVLGEPRVFADCRKVSHRFPVWARGAGLADLRFHDLRHTFASRLVMAGVDLVTVKELMGHKTLAMTLRYAHLSPSHQRQAVERLVQDVSDTGISTEPAPGGVAALETGPQVCENQVARRASLTW